jgi:hypothetical protein
VRDGRTLNFDRPNTPIPVNDEDLLRVRPDSRVVLRSREKATLTLGANSVFHVKPWESRGKTGVVRALFGRFRSSVVGLTGGEQFNVKTATATIGVKGTEKLVQVTNRGGSMLVVTDSTVSFQGQTGGESDVRQGFVSVIVGPNPPTPPVPVPPQLEQQFNERNLDSPEPNAPESQNFVAEQVLLQEGIVNETDLEQNRGDSAPEPPPAPQVTPPAPPRATNAPDASRALQRGRVPLQFQR